MKKILLSIAAVSAVAAAVPAVASAQSYGYDRGYERGHDRGYGYGHGGDRIARLDQRIDVGIRNGGLTRNEAWRLKGDLREVARLEARYSRDGLSRWERNDLDRRFDRISAQIRYERRDGDYRRY